MIVQHERAFVFLLLFYIIHNFILLLVFILTSLLLLLLLLLLLMFLKTHIGQMLGDAIGLARIVYDQNEKKKSNTEFWCVLCIYTMPFVCSRRRIQM